MAMAKGSEQELLDSQTHIFNHIYNYISSMSLKCAIQLGIADAIHSHGNPMPLSQLAAALSINGAKTEALGRLMRLLVHSKIFDKVKISEGEGGGEEEAYCLTGASRLLLRRGALSMAPLALTILDPVMMEPWHHVSEWFRDESASTFETKHGSTLWEYAAGEEKFNVLFNEGMASDAKFVASIIGGECRHVFEGVKSMVDVGGGTGATARAIAAAFPELKCVVLDLPQVVDGLEGCEKLSFVGGDMFESIPHADAVFLKWILHDWSDEDCIKILQKCKEAVTPSEINGGKVIIVDIVVGDREEEIETTKIQLFWDMQLMVEFNGKERTEKEWETIFLAAGFTNYKINHVLGLRSVIEVFP